MKKLKKLHIFALVGFLIILSSAIFLIYLNTNYTVIFSIKNSEKIGIIDEGLYGAYDNIITLNETIAYTPMDYTHGDKMLQFLDSCNFQGDVYYYAAVDAGGRISSEQILNGLEKLKEQGVKRINLSLSSKLYNAGLNEWIQSNSDIQIYASYNNRLNSTDYPAMYGNVIASGSDDRINYKAEDKRYSSSKILVLRNFKVHSFEGNSYLSLITMIKD